MSRDRLWGRIVPVLLLAVLATGVRGDDPLTTADLVRFLKAGISERTILAELHDRGFAEPLDATREAALREAGASETLVVAVRRARPASAPSAPASAPPAPASAPSAPASAARAPAGSPPAPAAAGSSRPRGGDAAFPAAEGPRGLTFSATTRSVRVPVSVLDKNGEPVLGLTSANFQVSEDGRPQPVTFFSGERQPLRIALALDVSTSMSNKMGEVSDALRHFINILEPADEILVMTFSADLHVEQDFTSDRERLGRVFSRLQPAPGTALYDAAIEAIRRVAPLPAESKAVVLVTDGMDTASRASFGDLIEIARRSEVPVFSLGIGTEGGLLNLFRPIGGMGPGGRGPGGGRWPGGGGRRGWPGGGGGGRWPGGGGGGGGGQGGTGPMGTGESDFDARPLRELAEDTGGRAEVLKGLAHDHGRVDRLKEAVESIAVTLRHRYLVGYEPQAQPSKPGWRKIKVEVDRPKVSVQARRGYYTEG